VRDLSYKYKNENRVAIPDFNIDSRGVFCITGANGSGKSTLLSLIAGLIPPTTGRIEFSFCVKNEVPDTSSTPDILFFSQGRDVMSMSVRDNVRMGMPFGDEEICEMLVKLGASSLLDELPDRLDTELGANGIGVSSGQKQILFATHLLLSRPRMALLDEISSNMDVIVKNRLLDLLEELGQESLVLVVTHDEDVLARFSNQIRLDAPVVSENTTKNERAT